MYLSAKKIKYADLVVPFTKCPFKNVEHDCLFTKYWELASIEKQIQAIENIPEKALDILRKQHQCCQERKVKNIRKPYKSRSIIEACNKDLIFDNL